MPVSLTGTRRTFSMNKADTCILCIEDDADTCELIEFVFTNEGCRVTTCASQERLKTIEEETFSAVVLVIISAI